MGSLEVVQALVSPTEKLIEAVSGAIGKAYAPHHIRKSVLIYETIICHM